MRIGIDARLLTSLPTSGVALFCKEIIEAMKRVSDDELVLFDDQIVSNVLRPWPIIGNHLAFARAVDRAKVDVFFSPTGLLPLGLKTPSVVFIHDLIILKHPEWFPDSLWQRFFTLRLTLPSTMRRARRIVVPSTVVRDDVGRFFPEAQGKMEVIPEGVRVNHERTHRAARTEPSILSVGTLEPRKNIETAIKAFEQVAQTHQDLEFVIIGSQGWGAQSILEAIDQANWRLGRQAVRYLGAVSEEEKWALYQNAKMLLAISHDEGFYLPPFEAMAVGTPVVATAVGAIPDLAKGAVELVSTEQVDDVARSLQSLLNDADRRRRLSEEARPVVVGLTWDRTAEAINKQLLPRR